MATSYPTPLLPCDPPNLDLIRRYCPHIAQHTHEEIAAHIHPDDNGCWLWDGQLRKDGYGVVSCQPTSYGAPQSAPVHRYMYDILVTTVPYRHHVHHRCHMRACWHPLHLQAVTPHEHVALHAAEIAHAKPRRTLTYE